jgi:hypothetical protein
MTRARYAEWSNPYDDIIRRLKADLYEARSAIVHLMPENTRKLLTSYFSCESRQQTYAWEQSVADEIIESAEVLPRTQGFYLSERAYCPLCGSGSTSPYESGFTIPEGLRRHLVGWGNTQQCDVMKAAFCLARECWDDRFRAAEQAEEVAKRERLEARKRSETLYRVMPDDDPRLVDEGIGYGTGARDQTLMDWAECRVAGLGFQTTSEGSVKSYVSERGDFVVYADPRLSGQIVFRVYKKPLPKKGRVPRARSARMSVFHLMDGWKHDLRGKYETRLGAAMATLS